MATQAPPKDDGEGSAIDFARQLEVAHAERDAAILALDALESVSRKVGGFMSYQDQIAMNHATEILEQHGRRKRKSIVWKDRP